MNKRIFALLAAAAIALSGCQSDEPDEETESAAVETVDPEKETEERLGMNVLRDPNFENGFHLLGMDSATDGSAVKKNIKFGSAEPAWKIAQWWSAYNLKDGEEALTDSSYRIADGHKSVTVDRDAHAVTLALNSSVDFAESTGKAPQKWPHLLLEQSIDGNLTKLKGAESLTAKLDFTIDRCEDLRTSRRGIHSQFAWFIYIVDTNPDSPGKGNFLWFGLNLFCPPNKETYPYSSQDTAGGPGNFIYSLPSTEIFEGVAEAGANISFELDILPHVKESLKVAQERGFMIGTTWEDCSVVGTNIGYENFDRWDLAITINDIGIYRK